MSRRTAGQSLPGGFVIPTTGVFFGADVPNDDFTKYEGSAELNRRFAIHRRHYSGGWTNTPSSANWPWPASAETSDANEVNPQVVPMIVPAATDGSASGFPVCSSSTGFSNTTTVSGHQGLDRVTAGEFDGMFDRAFAKIKAIPGPVFVILWQEMNIPAMGGYYKAQMKTGETKAQAKQRYISAWRHVHSRAVNAGATNIIWGWCPTSFIPSGDTQQDTLDTYPGDDVVDVVWCDRYRNLLSVSQFVYNFAVNHNKPFGIAESGFYPTAQGSQPFDEPTMLLQHDLPDVKSATWEELVFYIPWARPGISDNEFDVNAAVLSAYKTFTHDSYMMEFFGTTPPPPGPTITSFTPTSGPVGTQISIIGSGFTGASAVKFGGVAAATFSTVSDSEIVAPVPTGAVSGPITVVVGAQSVTSATSFIVQQARYTDSGLLAGTTYQYDVTAIDAAGNESPISNLASATTTGVPPSDTTPPTIPGNLQAVSVLDTSLTLTWQQSTDPDSLVAGYTITRNGSVVQQVSTTTFTDTGLTPGATYVYTVQAFDPSGNRSLSATITVTTQVVSGGCEDFCIWVQSCLTANSPTTPTITTPQAGSTIGNSLVTVSWTVSSSPYNASIPSYVISYDGGANYNATSGLLSDIRLYDDGAFVVAVVAVDENGLQSQPAFVSFTVNSSLSSSPSTPVITSPSFDNEIVETATVTVVWSASSGGQPPISYEVSYDGGGTWKTVGGSLTDTHVYPIGPDLILVRAVDAVGRVSSPGSRSFIVAQQTPTGQIQIQPQGLLGCGKYEAFVMTRGAGFIIMPLVISSYEWHRVLDDTSIAQVNIDGTGGAGRSCCQALVDVNPWEHELAIFRNGVRIWAGPIVSPVYPLDQAQIQARDLSIWWDRRVITKNLNYTKPGEDLAYIFRDYARNAMEADNSPGMVINVSPCGTRGARSVKISDYKLAGNDMRELARSGIDWTCIDRTILAGGKVVGAKTIALLTDDSFSTPPQVSPDGLQQATEWFVRGSGKGDSQPVGHARAIKTLRDKYGLIQQVVTEPKIKDADSAKAAARSRLELTANPPGVLDGGVLSTLAPVTIDHLIPGAIVHIVLQKACYPVDVLYRLKSVDVTGGFDQEEQVSVTFQPLGTTDQGEQLESEVTSSAPLGTVVEEDGVA